MTPVTDVTWTQWECKLQQMDAKPHLLDSGIPRSSKNVKYKNQKIV